MLQLYHEILYRPILNLLVFLYDILPGHDLGLAIIAVTIIIRFILYPSFRSSIRSQRAMQALQPKLEEVRAKHKDDKQAQMEAMMNLYKEHKVHPLSSCLPLLAQLPVILALFQVLNNQLSSATIEGLYTFVRNPGILEPISFGFLNLADRNIILAAIAAALQYWQTKMLQPKMQPGVKMEATAAILQKQMLYVLPIVTFIIAMQLPAGLPLYWATTTLFAIVQQRISAPKPIPTA
jgi:YidC/Oxa1 family membrane protein insertase